MAHNSFEAGAPCELSITFNRGTFDARVPSSAPNQQAVRYAGLAVSQHSRTMGSKRPEADIETPATGKQKMMRKSIWVCMLYMQLTHADAGDMIQKDALQVSARRPSDADFCRNGLFPREQESLSLGVIQGQKTEKVHFFDDFDGCPSNGAKCMRPTYLVPGDEVLVSKNTADWACVWYQGRKHESVSWVPKKNVVLRPASPIHPVRDWVGVWVDGPDKIRISLLKTKSELQILSSLRWDGGTSPDGEKRANYGGMKGTLDIHGSKASAVEGDCQVRLTRIGKYLVADDNGACGGMNVRHTGMYFRLPK